MGNVIQIKHGTNPPEVLVPNELGFCEGTNQLFIGDRSNKPKLVYAPFTFFELKMRFSTLMLRVNIKGLDFNIAKDAGLKIKFYRNYHRKTDYSWKCDDNEGYASIIGKTDKEDNTYPSAPNWMKNGGCLENTFSIDPSKITNSVLEISLNSWLLELCKPLYTDNSLSFTDRLGFVGLNNNANASLQFKAFIVDKDDNIIGNCLNTLCVGPKHTKVDGKKRSKMKYDIDKNCLKNFFAKIK